MNSIFTWDFTAPKGELTSSEIMTKLKNIAKKGNFQLEVGEVSGYEHWQGRISTIKKYRKSEIIKLNFLDGIHWSPTSNANKSNFDYVTKDYTRIDGPWDLKETNYIPRQIREISALLPWQKSITEKLSEWDTRTINLLYDPKGCIGKSILVGWVRAYKLGRALPPVNDYKDMMRLVCDLPTSRGYIIDMPRALKKDKLGGFYSAIESVKDGYAYDDRYTFTEKIFDCPNIWVTSNSLPEFNLLSKDRWRIWEVNQDKELVPYDTSGLF